MSGERLLIVDDDLSVRETLGYLFRRHGYDVELAHSGEDALGRALSTWPELVLTDLNMPGMTGIELLRRLKAEAAKEEKDIDLIVVTAFSSAATAIEALKAGAIDYVAKPFKNDELVLKVRRALDQRQLERDNLRLRRELETEFHFGNLVGNSPAMQDVYQMVSRVKDTRINCLIQGQSGTGKEMVARAIHFSGIRADGPFVPINCGAIPENLVESQLFGHKKGSFTGANRDKDGLLKAAHKGTIFLDEVASLPLSAQVKLLRALQERRFLPVGGVREEAVDVRVLAACNVDLEASVREGEFREDLYYRLNVVKIELPPLRERGSDVLELARCFLKSFAEEYGKPVMAFSPDARELLQAWHYPGNVRELRNIVERAIALCVGDVLTVQDLPPEVQGASARPVETEVPDVFPEDGMDLDAELARVERRWLVAALDASDGNKTQAARLLQMSFRSFRYRAAKYGLDS